MNSSNDMHVRVGCLIYLTAETQRITRVWSVPTALICCTMVVTSEAATIKLTRAASQSCLLYHSVSYWCKALRCTIRSAGKLLSAFRI